MQPGAMSLSSKHLRTQLPAPCAASCGLQRETHTRQVPPAGSSRATPLKPHLSVAGCSCARQPPSDRHCSSTLCSASLPWSWSPTARKGGGRHWLRHGAQSSEEEFIAVRALQYSESKAVDVLKRLPLLQATQASEHNARTASSAPCASYSLGASVPVPQPQPRRSPLFRVAAQPFLSSPISVKAPAPPCTPLNPLSHPSPLPTQTAWAACPARGARTWRWGWLRPRRGTRPGCTQEDREHASRGWESRAGVPLWGQG